MRKFVGVKPLIGSMFNLKEEALLFEQIVILGLRHHLREMEYWDLDDATSADIAETKWLIEQGIIHLPPEGFFDEHVKRSEEALKHFELQSAELDEVQKLGAQAGENIGQLTREDFSIITDKVARHGRSVGIHRVRLSSVLLREFGGLDAHPILPDDAMEYLSAPRANKSDVAQIVLGEMPLPDESVPWEQIIEYRSDPDSKGKFLALRNWMSETARAELSPVEVEEKLAWLMFDYQRHMRLHKMKTHVGMLETIVVTGAEMLENLVKFNWGKMARQLFSLKHRRIALLEEEMRAPGSETAYIIKTHERFP